MKQITRLIIAYNLILLTLFGMRFITAKSIRHLFVVDLTWTAVVLVAGRR